MIGCSVTRWTQRETGGLDAAKSGQLLSMLAPILMGALGQAKRTNGLDAGGLASMLDMNGDGNPLDDILKMAGKLMR